MKIPAKLNNDEMVYIVAIDTRNPADAICIFPDGSFGRVELTDLEVVHAAPTTSFVPSGPSVVDAELDLPV